MKIEVIEKKRPEPEFVVGGVYAVLAVSGDLMYPLSFRMPVSVGGGKYNIIDLADGQPVLCEPKTYDDVRAYVQKTYAYVPNAKLVVEVD